MRALELLDVFGLCALLWSDVPRLRRVGRGQLLSLAARREFFSARCLERLCALSRYMTRDAIDALLDNPALGLLLLERPDMHAQLVQASREWRWTLTGRHRLLYPALAQT